MLSEISLHFGILYQTVKHCRVQSSAVLQSAVQCSAVQCSSVQCSAVQYSAVQCSAAIRNDSVRCGEPYIWPMTTAAGIDFVNLHGSVEGGWVVVVMGGGHFSRNVIFLQGSQHFSTSTRAHSDDMWEIMICLHKILPNLG